MKLSIIRTYAALLVVVGLLSACSGPPENSGSSNSNATQQANSNPAEQFRAAQNNASPGTPIKVQPMPPPQPKPGGDSVKPAEKSPPDRNTNTGNASAASSAHLPKLVAPEQKIDFGKQPQDKTIIRAIAIRNAGRADLNIESVVPS